MTSQTTLTDEIGRMVRESCMCLHLQRTARTVGRRYDAALRPLGLSNGQFSLMVALVRPVPLTVGALAAELGMDRTTLTANLKPLRARGLVLVAIDRADRRNRAVSLTAAGRALLEQALPVWYRVQAEVIAQPNPMPAANLRRALRALAP
ncbi:MAG: MarR family winged helix-turn-helix transcriptional regulator [Alphaproteobacteria bacterium]